MPNCVETVMLLFLIVSETGYINSELFVKWMQQFISSVRPTKERPVLLLFDGHTIHSKNFDAPILGQLIDGYRLCRGTTNLVSLVGKFQAVNHWSQEIRARAVDAYIRGNSVIFAQRELRRGENRHHRVPNRRTMCRWVKQWRKNGSVVNTKHEGLRKIVGTPENIQRVRMALQQSPQRSVRRHTRTLRMSRTFLRRIVKSDLKFHPYRLQVCQELRPEDRQNRLQFCITFLQRVKQDETIFSALALSDEANFHLSGFVNKQILRYCADNFFMRNLYTAKSEEYPEMERIKPHNKIIKMFMNNMGICKHYLRSFDRDQSTITRFDWIRVYE
ncbi:hypothetical protein ANN_11430 [Periplaneta americana]|uniref:DDE-1 domain-containing protein n=1 Tax=Periplaneta americana TaxID=6978 RepID=A0ABQ8T6D1_PERAM|nr:hypothetical protein ANN_11430 [Periplaneta americana]